MNLKDLFQELRQPDFLTHQADARKILASYVVANNTTPQIILEEIMRNDWTGKNEVIAKVIYLIGGTDVKPPQQIADAADQLEGIDLTLNGENIEKWQKTLFELQEGKRRAASC
ncbi:hypothetical protein H6776_02925 [Candidatus Nomurabacteria bacterium]|nr:hypothetical protein [Candidatus Nomurabacteria bacterium]